MNIDELTIGQVREILSMFGASTTERSVVDNGMIGAYVIVRCRDAGVHAGVLVSHSGRECVLEDSRRLWFWKAARGAFLSGVAVYGLHEDSKIGDPVKIHLTENCEIILCTADAEQSIRGLKSHEPS